MCFTSFVGCTIISVWTIIQSIFHIMWSIYGYSLYMCHFVPSQYYLVFIHLTYFYKRNCDQILLDDYDVFAAKDAPREPPPILYQFIDEVLKKGELPTESLMSDRTNKYLLNFIILDSLWIVGSVLLFLGNYFKVKKYVSIIFFAPWITIAIVVNILDIVAAVHFGFDMRKMGSPVEWLKFVGVKNHEQFQHYNTLPPDSQFFIFFPSVILSSLSCRFLLMWIFNVICLYQVFDYFIVAFQVKKISHRKRRSQMSGCSRSTLTSQLNNSEARIRQWQLFYGASDLNETASSTENERSDMNSMSRPLPRSYSSPNVEFNKPTTSSFAVQRHKSFNGSSYHQFSDVAEFIGTHPVQTTPMKTLRGQLPWSYVHDLDERKLELAKSAKVRHESITIF